MSGLCAKTASGGGRGDGTGPLACSTAAASGARWRLRAKAAGGGNRGTHVGPLEGVPRAGSTASGCGAGVAGLLRRRRREVEGIASRWEVGTRGEEGFRLGDEYGGGEEMEIFLF